MRSNGPWRANAWSSGPLSSLSTRDSNTCSSTGSPSCRTQRSNDTVPGSTPATRGISFGNEHNEGQDLQRGPDPRETVRVRPRQVVLRGQMDPPQVQHRRLAHNADG